MLSENEIKEIMDNVQNGFLSGKVQTSNKDGSCDIVEWQLKVKIYRED